MSTTTTQVNITAKDSTAAAFASAKKNLTDLAINAVKAGAAMGGIGLSIAGAFQAVRGISQATIQLQQFTSTLQVGTGSAKGAADALAFVRAESNRLGLDLATSAEQFAKLTAASKGTALEGKATRDIFTSVSQAATAMGLSADQTAGSLLAIQQMISKGTVSAEELRGQLGERLPGAFQIAARAIGVTTAELDKMLRTGQVTAERLLPALSAELNKTFGAQAEQSAQGLTAQINRMNTAFFDLKIAIGESGLINFLSSGIELATKLTNTLTKGFGGGPKLSPVDAQVSQIKAIKAEMESMKNLTHVPLIGGLLFDKKEFDLLQHRLETATDDLKALEAAASKASNVTATVAPTGDPRLNELMEEGRKIAEKYADPLKALQELQKKYKELLDAGAISQDVYNRALKAANDQYAKPGIKQRSDELNKLNKAQSDALRIESEYVKLLQIEKKQREDLIAPYRESAKQANTNLVQMQDQIAALQLVKDRQITLKEAVELTTIARLNERKASAKDPQVISQINAEIEARKKIADLIPLHAKLEQTTRRTTDQMSQLWIQAGRNIQSQLANSIFIFFDDGLDGMVKSVGNAVARIASEFAALKLAQMTGLSQIFAMPGMTGSMANGGMGGGLTLAGMFGNNPNQVKAESFALNAWGNSGASTNSTGLMGRLSTGLGGMSAGGALGAFGVLAASVGLGSSIAGDKKVFGIDGKAASIMGAAMGGPVGAVVAGAINAIFGRSPFKFRQQSLQGTASAEGFEGDFTNVFRSKGGLLSSNKHKSRSQDLTTEQQDVFDSALDSFYKSAHSFAENLGLSTDLVDNFTKEFSIVSEKNQQLTEEAISNLLIGVGDDIAKNVLPIVDSFRKTGETSFETFQRLSNEFTALQDSAVNLGASLQFAKELLKASTFEGRFAFVEAAGGIDALVSKTKFFSDNFLTDAERIAPMAKSLSEEMQKLGLSSDITRDDFEALVQSFGSVNGITEETLQALLGLAPAFVTVNGLLEVLEQGAMNLGATAELAQQLVTGMSLESRTALVDLAGGTAALNQQTSFFFQNVLSESERLSLATHKVSTELNRLGLSADLTVPQFKELIQSLGTPPEVRAGLLKLQQDFLAVKNAQGTLSGTTNTLAESERSLNDIRQELLSSYGKERGELESTIDKFKNISASLRDFKNSLALGELSPLSPAQKLEEARAQFNRTRALANQGDQGALEALPRVSQEFLQASQTYNASSAAFISDFNLVKGVLDSASKSAISQAEVAKIQLDKLTSTVEYLTGIDDKAKTTNELLKELLVATLTGSGNSSISTKDIQSFLANNPGMSAEQIANAATKFGVSKNQLVQAGIKESDINKYTGGKTVTDQQIRDFVNSGASPRQIYDAAVANGVSSMRLSAVTGISKTDIDKFVKDNRLPSFAKGTDFVAKSGLAMVHRAEAIVPSSTTDEVKKMREELTKLRQEQNQQTGDLMRVIDISDHKNAKLIADALAQIERQRVWNERAKAGLR